MVDFFNLTAQRVHNMPEGWQWCQLDSHNKPEDFIEVIGAVTVGEYKSGPRAGRPKWPKKKQTIWMRRRDIDRVVMEWERETGKCHKCDGSGSEAVGWSKSEGVKTQICKRCQGSGKSPENLQ